ncbi:MAG: tripartite tricarboxylate transporter substrate binding protein [Rhodospirillaceae bacterium]
MAADYPSQPIKVLIPFAAGGTTDVSFRKLGSIVEKTLKQPIVIENKPGGSGTIAIGTVARSKPDGYTLGAITSSPAFITPGLRDVGYDPAKDLTPILNYSGPHHGVVVLASSKWKTMADLIADAKANPGTITYGTAGTFAGAHISFLYLEHLTGAKFTHVPFKGQSPATAALLGGHVSMALVPAYADYVKAGKVRVLADMDVSRDPEIPDVPTWHELGYDWEFPSVVGLVAPANLPEDIRAKLEAAFMQAAATPEFKEFMDKVHQPVRLMDGAAFGKLIVKNALAYKKAITDLGLHE